ncbi:MAG: chemotaxis-specific protein-glutamate methyltransferase CheB [Candidatus Thermoplasmatota archaeon]|nr:chemotaxis-specific protein-glutamate methyltransferase CheB [Candidatus Thermoplasmatota archaeon]
MPSNTDKIKAAVVDDSNFMVTVLKDILEGDDRIEVVGTGKDGREAIELNKEKDLDVILIDIKMESMDGLTAVKNIMSDDPTPILVISGLGDEAERMSVKAFEAGAVDFISKTSGSLSMDIRKKTDVIIDKILKAAETDLDTFDIEEKKVFEEEFSTAISEDWLIVLASSTGGTRALDEFLSIFPSNFPVPIIVVQHMPPDFIGHLSRTLDSKLDLPVKEATDNEMIEDNQVYIVPSSFHGIIKTEGEKGTIGFKKGPKLHGVKPSADYLFSSASEEYGDRLIGVVLTGMGEDGAEGAKQIRDNGGFVALQDEKSSVVYGMPKSAKELAGCDFEGSPTEIGRKVVEMFMEDNE